MPATTKELRAWWSRRGDHAEHRRAHINRSTLAPRAGPVTAWTTWAALTWARTCPPWMHADGLSASQRLLLGMVLFGPVTYRQAADQTGHTPAQVSQLCAAALRQLALAAHPADGTLRA